MVMASNISKYSFLGDFQQIWLIHVISFQFFGFFFFFFLRCSCFFLDQKKERLGWLLQNNMKNNILNNKNNLL